MIAVDTNVLVYAHRAEFPLHEAAVAALFDIEAGPEPWGIPAPVVGEFLRVVTHRRAMAGEPSTLDDALAALSSWLSRGGLLRPGPRHLEILSAVARDARATANLAHDAQIVATCRENGATTIVTEDRDFRRFRGIVVRALT